MVMHWFMFIMVFVGAVFKIDLDDDIPDKLFINLTEVCGFSNYVHSNNVMCEEECSVTKHEVDSSHPKKVEADLFE